MNREEECRNPLFRSEWELEEWEKTHKDSKRRDRKEGLQLTEEEERLDNRDAWTLQEERHYQWLEDEYNGVKHRRPGRRKNNKKTKETT